MAAVNTYSSLVLVALNFIIANADDIRGRLFLFTLRVRECGFFGTGLVSPTVKACKVLDDGIVRIVYGGFE